MNQSGFYIFIIWANDVFAYLFGITLGRHRLFERISPKKSWEGAIGGTIIGTLVASLFAFMFGSLFPGGLSGGYKTIFDNFANFKTFDGWLQFTIIFAVTLFASIVSQVGDLVASKMKRTYDVKDFGTIFPGHGGFLDRFDSAIYTAMLLLAVFLVLSQVIA